MFAGLWTGDRPTMFLPWFVSNGWGERKGYYWGDIWQYEEEQNDQLQHSGSYGSQGVSFHEKRYPDPVLACVCIKCLICVIPLLQKHVFELKKWNTFSLALQNVLKVICQWPPDSLRLRRKSLWLEEPFHCGPEWNVRWTLQAENEEFSGAVSLWNLASLSSLAEPRSAFNLIFFFCCFFSSLHCLDIV